MVSLEDGGAVTTKIIDLGLAKTVNEPGAQTAISTRHSGMKVRDKEPEDQPWLEKILNERWGGLIKSDRL